MTDWQPIITAPMDGTWILLHDGLNNYIGYWDAYYAKGGWGYNEGTGWIEAYGVEPISPTDWQPLPEPPKESK